MGNRECCTSKASAPGDKDREEFDREEAAAERKKLEKDQ